MDVQKLKESESNKLEGPLAKSELSFSLKNMTNNRSPGTSGFALRIFIKFFGIS